VAAAGQNMQVIHAQQRQEYLQLLSALRTAMSSSSFVLEDYNFRILRSDKTAAFRRMARSLEGAFGDVA